MWTIIKKGVMPPDDFIIESELNREKYIIESGWQEQNKWRGEHESYGVTPSMVGENVLGTNVFQDIRYRLRTKEDSPFDASKTLEGILVTSLFSSVIGEK